MSFSLSSMATRHPDVPRASTRLVVGFLLLTPSFFPPLVGSCARCHSINVLCTRVDRKSPCANCEFAKADCVELVSLGIPSVPVTDKGATSMVEDSADEEEKEEEDGREGGIRPDEESSESSEEEPVQAPRKKPRTPDPPPPPPPEPLEPRAEPRKRQGEKVYAQAAPKGRTIPAAVATNKPTASSSSAKSATSSTTAATPAKARHPMTLLPPPPAAPRASTDKDAKRPRAQASIPETAIVVSKSASRPTVPLPARAELIDAKTPIQASTIPGQHPPFDDGTNMILERIASLELVWMSVLQKHDIPIPPGAHDSAKSRVSIHHNLAERHTATYTKTLQEEIQAEKASVASSSKHSKSAATKSPDPADIVVLDDSDVEKAPKKLRTKKSRSKAKEKGKLPATVEDDERMEVDEPDEEA